ncbi:hypothetical protein ACUN0C_17415, partial [Faunimonas sp. B44]|uniref:hypothetical protein n=1 Tax=Faunimonas sp. B44 TaxID=3461493 RepID=UPI0040448B5A
KLDQMQADKARLDTIMGWLSVVPKEPVEPTCTITMSSEDLAPLAKQQQEHDAEQRALRAELKRLPKVEVGDVSAIEAWEAWQAREAFLRQHPMPTMTAAEIAAEEAAWGLYDLHCDLADINQHIEEHLSRGYHECPKCEHRWAIEQSSVDRLRDEALNLENEIAGRPCPAEPMDKTKLERAKRILANWEAHCHDFVDAPEAPKPGFTRQDIENQARRAEIEAQIDDTEHEDFTSQYQARLVYERDLARYEQELESYRAWQAECNAKEAEALSLADATKDLLQVQDQYQKAIVYETQLAAFNRDLVRYQETQKKVKELREAAEAWKKAKAALVTLRSLVNQHLVPSLNRVASHLIKQMTGGQRQVVEVDEEFEITVDGQSINTLSGSGKAVANLALRIALGQVLTNNVLSLFIGDEIDASMDKDRAENTSVTLRGLGNRISQILLVTHKYPSADYYIPCATHSSGGETLRA